MHKVVDAITVKRPENCDYCSFSGFCADNGETCSGRSKDIRIESPEDAMKCGYDHCQFVVEVEKVERVWICIYCGETFSSDEEDPQCIYCDSNSTYILEVEVE